MRLCLANVPALSSLPGLIHGFEQRAGTSAIETRAQTSARVRSALDGAGRLLLMRQVHGTVVLQAPWAGTPAADAGVAAEPGLLVGVATADCLPVFLVDPARRAVAAAHAGWRGTAGRIVTRVVEALVAGGSHPEDLLAAIGPGIGPCCYEVGEELREEFGSGSDTLFRRGPRGRPHLDVRAANVRQLEEAGARPERIHHVDDCTSCRSDLYYSYRRDGPGTGRMISFVGFRAPLLD